MDLILGFWEIVKFFFFDQGGYVDIKSVDDMDIVGILNLMFWCSYFIVLLFLIKVVCDI